MHFNQSCHLRFTFEKTSNFPLQMSQSKVSTCKIFLPPATRRQYTCMCPTKSDLQRTAPTTTRLLCYWVEAGGPQTPLQPSQFQHHKPKQHSKEAYRQRRFLGLCAPARRSSWSHQGKRKVPHQRENQVGQK